MKQEHKELLRRDLCARLPYGIKAPYYGVEEECETWDEIRCITFDGYVEIGQYSLPIERIKPYLFPLSSMTEEQEDEWYEVFVDPLSKKLDRHTRQEGLQLQADAQAFGIEYLLKNHFDIYGLIPMGLAIPVTKENNPYK